MKKINRNQLDSIHEYITTVLQNKFPTSQQNKYKAYDQIEKGETQFI